MLDGGESVVVVVHGCEEIITVGKTVVLLRLRLYFTQRQEGKEGDARYV